MIGRHTKTGPGGLPLVSYAIVCVVWGSTYLAIRIGVNYLPPALMGAFRFLAAGAALLAVAFLLGQRLPARAVDWRTNAVVGFLLLGVANGLVIWSEQFVHSGVAAIFVVTVSLWMALFDAIIPGSSARATPVQGIGLLLGFAGTLILVGGDIETLREADWRGPLALTVAAASWALGSVIAQRRPTTSPPFVNAALQMLTGGTALLVAATIRGEWATLRFAWPGVGAVAYLTLFGSVVGFTAYTYVLRHWPATVAGTYVYVNTIVAVFLGWLVLAEPVTDRTTAGMAVVMLAVMIVRRASRQPAAAVRVASRRPALSDSPCTSSSSAPSAPAPHTRAPSGRSMPRPASPARS